MKVIRVNNLKKYYKRRVGLKYGYTKALRGLDLEVEEGGIYAILGPNGAGKTTALRCILGLIKPTSGTIEIMGKDVNRYPLSSRINVGYMPENIALPENTRVRSYLFNSGVFYLPPGKIRQRISEVASMLGIEDKLDMKMYSLSQGYRRRVLLAQALIHDPEILILDEPTNGLDPEAIVEFRVLIRELNAEGKTILFSSHILDEVQRLAAEVIIINRGKVVLKGGMSQILDRMKRYIEREFIIGGRGITPEIIGDILAKLGIDGNVHGSERGVILTGIRDEELESIVRELFHSGYTPTEIVPHEPTLEDVYMKVVGGEIEL